MAVRISKICKEYNVGMGTVIEYLEQCGFQIGHSPNTKLSDEQCDLVAKRFGGTRLLAIQWKEDPFTLDAQANRNAINVLGWNHLRNDTFIATPTRSILIPKDQNIETLLFWSINDIEKNCPNAIEGRFIIKERLSDPSGSIPVIPFFEEPVKVVQQPAAKEIRKIKTEPPKNLTSPSVLGKIDLSAQSQIRRLAKRKDPNKNERSDQAHAYNSESVQTQIRDIWQRFVDIQERLIKQRCTPISIIPDSIEIENDKLYATVDESQNERQLDAIFKKRLGIESYNLDSGFILVDEKKWNSLTEAELTSIRKGLSECYVELDTTPTINVTINYGKELNRSDQLSIEELHQMDSILNNGTLIEGFIEDTAAFISKVTVQREEYLRYLFGDHYVVYEKKRKSWKEPQIVERFEYYNKYIPWDVMRQYAHIGLECNGYTIIFKINNPKANKILRDCYDCYFTNTETFEFRRSFTKEEPCHINYVEEVNGNIQAFLNEAALYCSLNEIQTDVLFVYSIAKHQLVRSKLHEVGQYIKNKGDGYSYNDETGTIGIDFNWREQNIDDFITDIEKNIPFVKVNVHDDHRFKCKVHSQLIGFEALKARLESKYEDIVVENDSVFHQIKIRLPYVEAAYYELKRASLESDLQQMVVTGIEVHFDERIHDKIRLNISYNNNSRLEDLKESITDIRKADFGFVVAEKEVPFGRLLKVNYPDLVFEIDVDDEEKDNIIEAFESKAVTTIVPILTGDLEKISRLKNTFTKATTGAELVNPRLQRFIFDSSEATKTPDIDLMLRHNGTVYRELCDHLLNTKINESQKDAIIKAMFADDLAVIQGPPGTGKSTAIAEMIWQLVRKGFGLGNRRERILLTSETNLAVDNAISRIVNSKTNLVKPVRFGGEEKLEPEGLQFSIELMKRWVEEGDACLVETEADEETDQIVRNNLILKNWLSNIANRSFYKTVDTENDIISTWRNYLENPSKVLREMVYNRYVENANVIGATCSSIGDRRAGNAEFNGFTPFFHNYCDVFKQNKGKAHIEFTTVIQDESSKSTPAELVLPFVYGRKAIVIGDHRQLPPMLDKEEFEETLDYAFRLAENNSEREEVKKLKSFVDQHFEEMEVSHFQRLYENIDSSLKATFNYQYRMHPDINEVIEQFYRDDGGLRCGLTTPEDLGVNDPDMSNPASRYHGLDIPGLISPNTHVLFIESTSPEMMDGTSRVNYGEIETIDRLLSRFEHSQTFQNYLNKFSNEDDRQIGIISFYGKQIKQLRSIAHKHSSIPIRVSTVDRFQGMERNIVIVSMVRSNIIESAKNQQPDRRRYPEHGYPTQKSLGFAQSPNRLNVALSRAKRLLVIVGNRELFSKLDIYQRLFLTIEMNKNNKILKQGEV